MPTHIWTDGSNSPKGPGLPIGYAAVIDCGDDILIELAAWCATGTNNSAELKAAIIGLQAINPGPAIQHGCVVCTDSQYVLNQAMGNHRTKANAELVHMLQALRTERNATFEHVRGHAGVELNERADQLARWARHCYPSAEVAGAESVLVKCDFLVKGSGRKILSKEEGIVRYLDPQTNEYLVLRV